MTVVYNYLYLAVTTSRQQKFKLDSIFAQFTLQLIVPVRSGSSLIFNPGRVLIRKQASSRTEAHEVCDKTLKINPSVYFERWHLLVAHKKSGRLENAMILKRKKHLPKYYEANIMHAE